LGIKRDYEKMYDAYLDNIGLSGLRFKTEKPLPVSVDQQLQQQTQQGEQLAPTEVEQFTQANVEQ